MGLRFLKHKAIGFSPFVVIHGLIPSVPLRKYEILPWGEWDDREFNLADLFETIQNILAIVVDRK